ncbi:hypothetical protein H257_15065 [Aphanomyces astaci]|uniref:Uncharacterized protein n=1 Tax=Aphanomyces astaci TaxID=112090 RepID=W4FNR6_APHAT|nr:hypothetical protein H257_15065 [Aphanomyces astaci]ETV69095.1 hypothetical protein H257_15065 [Aphanomyces astaci]|eukprot:XP_009841348.1 hypothetical protein H257_15065 [Aphanomyces astaci]
MLLGILSELESGTKDLQAEDVTILDARNLFVETILLYPDADKRLRPNAEIVLSAVEREGVCGLQINYPAAQAPSGKPLNLSEQAKNERRQVTRSSIHLDEKWFNADKDCRKVYLVGDEVVKQRPCKSKRFISKIMFLGAVARPREAVGFDGKIGMWRFVSQVGGARSTWTAGTTSPTAGASKTISTSSASLAKRKLVKHLYGSVDMAFEKVGSYFELLKARNPGYCLRYIVANINTAQGRPLSSTEEGLAFKLARSDSHETFARHMEKLRALNPDAADYLLTIHVEHGVTYAFTRSTFVNVTSNMSEFANQWLGTELRSSDAKQQCEVA